MNKKPLAILTLFVLSIAPSLSWAAFVTTNQADMNTIFSQASFGPNTVDIRFQPTVTITNGSLLNINSLAKLTTLFGLSPVASPGINMFFVDSVSVCNLPDPAPGISGCATINGNDIVVASNAAANPTMIGGVTAGALLNGHELAHNLGLSHTSECTPSNPANLMDCQLLGFALTGSQVTTILASGLLQTDPTGLYVDITPVLIVPIPLPAALPLMLGALGLLGLARGRSPRAAA